MLQLSLELNQKFISRNMKKADWVDFLPIFIWRLQGFFQVRNMLELFSSTPEWMAHSKKGGKVIKIFKARFQPVAFMTHKKFVNLLLEWLHNVDKLDMWQKCLHLTAVAAALNFFLLSLKRLTVLLIFTRLSGKQTKQRT